MWTEANTWSHDFIDAGVKHGVYLLCSVELHLHKLPSEQTYLWAVLVYCWNCWVLSASFLQILSINRSSLRVWTASGIHVLMLQVTRQQHYGMKLKRFVGGEQGKTLKFWSYEHWRWSEYCLVTKKVTTGQYDTALLPKARFSQNQSYSCAAITTNVSATEIWVAITAITRDEENV